MLNLIFEKNKTMDVKPSINSATASVTKVTLDNEKRPTIPDRSELCDEERDFYRIMFGKDIASVRYQKLHCTACDVHIGSAPAKANNMWAHPVLRTLLCTACREFYGDGNFEQGEDATDMFCRWCANGGNLYCCSFCSNTFCNKCIRRNFTPAIRKTIEDDEAWKCLVCDPKVLYTARAVCWAIMQHVQTVTRILLKDKSIPDEEFRRRMMNLDESRCCRKRRAKRRKYKISDSEGDDETYQPDVDELCLSERRKTNRKMPRISSSPITNGESPKSPAVNQKLTKSRLTLNSFSNETEEDELPPPMIPCVQSMVEGESNENLNKTLKTDSGANAVNTGSEGPTSQPQINPIPTANLLKPNLPPTSQTASITLKNKLARQLQRILPGPKPRMKMLMLKHRLQPASPVEYSSLPLRAPSVPPNVPMVAIPAVSSVYNQPTNVIGHKRNEISVGQSSPVNESPVIEIDSDSDDTCTPEPSCEISEVNDLPEIVTIPHEETEIMQQELRMTKRLDMPQNSMENELDFRTEAVKRLFKTIGTELRKIPFIQLPHNNSLRTTRIKTRRFHLAIARAISELNEINDDVINKYVNWRKVIKQSLSTDNVEDVPSSWRNYYDNETEDLIVPLDMICTNSGSEPDDDEELDPEESCLASKVRSILLFKERDTIDVGIGESFTTADKSVQVDDVIPRDYEKCIGHSVLTKVEYDPTDGSEILKPVIVPAEYDGKYEEQFIFYLQRREELPIETDDEKGLPDPNETPLKDLIEANSPFVLEMLESIDSPLANGGTSSADGNIEGVANGETETDEAMIVAEASDESGEENKERGESTNVVKELAKIVTELSEDLKTGSRNDDDSLSKKHSENGKKDKRKEEFDSIDTEEVDVAVQALIEEDERSRSSNNDEDTVLRRVRYLGINDKASPIRISDDECTIID